MSNELDDFDIVAAEDEPQLLALCNPLEDLSTDQIPQEQQQQQPTAPEALLNHIPFQLLRRISETVTESILSNLEHEKQQLLGSNERPQPPPRAHTHSHTHSHTQAHVHTQPQPHVCFNEPAKRSRQQHPHQQEQEQLQQQQQANNKALVLSDNMTQYGNTVEKGVESGSSSPSHTKLDIQKFSEEYNNGLADGGGGGGGSNGEAAQNAATIILTPTSLNLTNTTQNVVGNNGAGGYDGREDVYKGPKWWRHLVLHWSLISEQVALLAIFLAVWAMAWVLLPDFAEPQTVIMRIAFLFVGAQISGILVTFLHLPDMLGMLFFGMLYTNVGLANFGGYQRFELFMREMALVNIMLLAGLGLDGSAFKRLWLMILRLTLLPTIVEVAIITVLAYFTLGMSWLWGIALGLVITAVSPNVVVTVMLKLKEERLGLNSGIHTLIYAMTTCNDVVSIFMFGVIVSVIFSTSSLTQQVLQGPIGIGIGLVFGYLYGMMLQHLPSRNAVYANGLRFVLTILGGALAVMGSRVIGYTSAGALGCVTMAFIAGIGWKRDELKLTAQQLQDYHIASVPKRLDLLWKFLKPVSFALIGKEINFAVLDGRVIGYGALLVLLGSLFRLAFAYLSTYGGNLSRKERAYITISGFPKATVQAALGPVALDLARAASVVNETQLALASNVLIISVLAIIFTAPLGAILMLRLAPIWLKRGDAVDAAEAPATPTARNNAVDPYKIAQN